ncbi:MAG: protein kinase [Phycisphaeraceae bacterium]|nr:protein kinase [Phycisphaerales bacterium]MCB9843643.1 protein kinase [Phycisphaeraceae bacterium]
MSSGQPDLARAYALYGELCDLAEAERATRLDAIRSAEPAVHQMLIALFDDPDEEDDLVERVRDTALAGVLAATDRVGTRIGPYRIEALIGEGSFGRVYRAARDFPFEQTVAIKVLHSGLDSISMLKRFEQERQSLALMSHPAIAQIYDAGTSDDGRPFVAMEYVKGLPITKWAKDLSVPLDTRIRVLAEVCDAVQHAHQKGVIHRDLTPNNILVSQDGTGHAFPKIIDFGIAKAVEKKLSGGTIVTYLGTPMGTPPYASPEQISGSKDIDTRTDVYTLGAVLYELVSGVPMFDTYRIANASIAQIIEMICQETPTRPSIANHDSNHAGVKARRAAIKDLDWIAMRCLEKERDRRYDSAGALADDLRRCLNGEAVEAGPPTARYRIGKFVRRHRFETYAAGFAVLIMLIGIAVVLLSFLAVIDQRDRAREADRKTNTALRQTSDALADAAIARDESVDSERRSRWEQYRLSVSLAALALGEGRAGDAYSLLQSSPEEFRGEDWQLVMAAADSHPRCLVPDSRFVRILTVGDSLFVLDQDGLAERLDPNSGETQWSTRIGYFSHEACLSPDKKMIAVAASRHESMDGGIVVIDAETGSWVDLLLPYEASWDDVVRPWRPAFLSDNTIIGKDYDSNSYVRYSLSGHPTMAGQEWMPEAEAAFYIGSFPNDPYLMVGTSWGVVTVFDIRNWRRSWSESLGNGRIRKICVWGDPPRAAVGTGHGRIRYYPTPLEVESDGSSADAQDIANIGVRITDLVVNSEGSLIAAACADDTVRLWSLETGDLVRSYGGFPSYPLSLDFSADGTRIYCACLNGGWAGTSSTSIGDSESPDGLYWIRVAPTYKSVAAQVDTERKNSIYIDPHDGVVTYLTSNGTLMQQANDVDVPTQCIQLAPKSCFAIGLGGRVVVGSPVAQEKGDKGGVRFTDLQCYGGYESEMLWKDESAFEDLNLVGLNTSPDGRYAVAISYFITPITPSTAAPTCRVFDVESGSILWDVTIGQVVSGLDYPGDAAFSRDNSKLFIAGETGGAGAFAVLDSATGELLSHFTKYTDWARSMAIDPHERYGATGHQDGAVILWDLDDGKSRRVIGTHYQRVTSLCFSPSGERLLSAAGSKIFAWDVETGNKLYELEMGTDPIYEMKIVEDGATLVLVTNTEIRWIPLQSTIEADPPPQSTDADSDS